MACRTTARIRARSRCSRRSTSITPRCCDPIEQLSKTNDGDGTLLDHSLVLYGSNMGNSNQHVHYDAAHPRRQPERTVKGNRHIAYPSKTVPTGNLLLTVLDKFGISQDSIGDSEGKLAAL
jgi:hypothetical protein